jgi:hypothetical protein
VLALAGFASMFRNPLIHLARKLLGRTGKGDGEGT